MNEEDFVDYLQNEFSFSGEAGIGDDCSVTRYGDTFQIITTDMLVEDVHFDLKYYSVTEIALRSLGVNLSDIAAMGGVPGYFYLSVGFPEKFMGGKEREFFDGIKNGCKKWDIELAGGDISRSEKLVISVTMVGTAKRPVMRSGASVGELIGITGVTGESYVGLELLKRGKDISRFSEKHKNVIPELKRGKILGKYVSSMIDVSDGLVKDLKRILSASQVPGALINYEKIPLDQEMHRLCREEKIDEYRAVLSGGEDFILLFTISPEEEERLRKEGIKYYIIGKITGDTGVGVTHKGKSVDISYSGFDHFQ